MPFANHKQNKTTIFKKNKPHKTVSSPHLFASSRKSNCFLKQLMKETKQIFSMSLGAAPSGIPFSPTISSNSVQCLDRPPVFWRNLRGLDLCFCIT